MTASATVQTSPTSNYSAAELDRIQKWQSSNDRRLALYWQRRNNPRKNRGPKGRGHAWGDLPDRTTWHVVHDVPVAGGTVLGGGLVVPTVGAVLHNMPLAEVCRSRGQGLKALKRARKSHPDARLVGYCRVMSKRGPMIPDSAVKVSSISANEGAPSDWYSVRSTAGSAA